MREGPDVLDGAVGRLAVIATAGLGLGVLVGGVLGRLAMFALVRMSPDARGLTSDDGFEMGRFTVGGSLNLLLVGGVLGTVGAAVYAAVRWLQPRRWWLRVTATSLCAGVGVGALVVHRDGLDFNVLEAGPAIALFVLVPATYGALLATAVESVLARHPGGVGPRWARWVGLLPFVVVPVLPLFALTWWVGRVLDGTRVAEVLHGAVVRWTGRALASGALLLLARDLVLDAAALT
jgi:hypothetical protein